MVGCTKAPVSPCLAPPVTSLAPSALPFPIRPRIFSICSLSTSAPCSVASSKGSPTTLSLALPNQAQDLLHLLLVHLGALLGGQFEGVPHHPPLGPLVRALHELVVNRVLDEGAGPRATALALVEEEREVRLLHGSLHVGV